MSGRYVIRTFGCQMNEHDSERIAGLLESDGYVRAEDATEAQVVVLNTCAVRENADNRLYGNLGHLRPLKQANPRLRIVVAGCLAQKDRGQIQERAPWVDVVVGTHALPGLLELLLRAETEGPQMDVREFTEVFPSALPARRGVVELTLLGQNVNTYGRDLTVPGSSRKPLFANLLRTVNDVEGIRRIRFTSPHPHDFTPDVVEAMAECEKVCEHIHFPLQSGSDRILRAMQRSYRSERYLSWLNRIRDAIHGVAVTTDIIVGFPGETEEDFRGTLDVVGAARFDQAYTFQYSPRPGTVAATMPHQIPKEVVQERFDRLVQVQESISLERMRATVGRTFEVLVEGVGRKGGVQGRTRTNKVVHVPGTIAPGTFLDARIVAAHPHHLSGEVIRVEESAAAGSPREPAAAR